MWDHTAGRFGDFIRLRRSDADLPSPRTVATNDLPSTQSAAEAGGLTAALQASRDVTSPPPRLRDWQDAATRRLELDAALATLNARVAAGLVDTGVAG